MKTLYLIPVVVILLAATSFAQPVCDFLNTQNNPTMSWTRNGGYAYTTWSAGSHNWEIINNSGVGTPTGSPYVLHTNGNSTYYYTTQYLVSQQFTGFHWNFNEIQWTFWFGRRQDCSGYNGEYYDASTVWLYLNRNTSITNTSNLEGIRMTWYHAGQCSIDDRIQFVEVYGNTEHLIADFRLLPTNLCCREWGTTVMVNRIPAGTPTGSQVRWQIRMSTPPTNTPNFTNYLVTADADPTATATYLKLDTTLSIANSWTPASISGHIGVMSDYSNTYRKAAEYNQICVLDKGPVPVELTSFSAQYRNDEVRLDWRTETEINNSGFEIQRSVEHNGSWETIAFVEGQGNSNKPVDYSYTDAPKFDGAKMIAYRLKQIDIDGSYEYSNTVLVSIKPATARVLYNFPNPFNPVTNINFNLEQEDVVSLSVFNTAGDKVNDLYTNQKLSAGYYTVPFDGAGLPSGTYFYKLTTSDRTTMNSMVLSK